ncbi:MAG: hypothetical protein IIB19_02700 [Chloroflexi bacterium]|nr:hypothetical protein [Chloroflexota bacterium]
MNGGQLAQQIKFELGLVVWDVPSGTTVVGDDAVRVTSGEPTEEQIPSAFPFCFVVMSTGVGDEWDSNLINQTITVMCMAAVGGDPIGEHAVIGGSTDDLTKSYGRGVHELAERARFAVRDLNGADGNSLLVTSVDISTPRNMSGTMVVIEEFTVNAMCTSDAQYTSPQELKLAGSIWTWAGADMCRGRFDFVEYDLVFKAGATAPTDPADGTSAGKVSGAETITVDSLASKTYCIFAVYNARKNGLVEGASEPIVGSIKTT